LNEILILLSRRIGDGMKSFASLTDRFDANVVWQFAVDRALQGNRVGLPNR